MNFVSAIDFYGDLIVTLTKVPAISEAQNFAWNVFLTSLNCGKIGESHSQSLGRFTGSSVHCSSYTSVCLKVRS